MDIVSAEKCENDTKDSVEKCETKMTLNIQEYPETFKNANNAVLNACSKYNSIRDYSISEHKRQFKEMHGCEIVKGESWGNWEKLIFNTEEDATMFLLKWS